VVERPLSRNMPVSNRKKKKDAAAAAAAAAEATADEGGQEQEELEPQTEDEEEESRVLALEAELKAKDATIATLMEWMVSHRGGPTADAAEASREAHMAELQEACEPAQLNTILEKVADFKLLAAAEQGNADGAKATGKGSNYNNLNRTRSDLKKADPRLRLFQMKAALAGELGQLPGRPPLQLRAGAQNKFLAHLVEHDVTRELAHRVSEDKSRPDSTDNEPTRLLLNETIPELLQKLQDVGRLSLTGDTEDFTQSMMRCPAMIYHAAYMAKVGEKMILEVAGVLSEVISSARIHRFLQDQHKYSLTNSYGELNLPSLLRRDDRVSRLIDDLYRHAAPGGAEQASQLVAAFEADKHDGIMLSNKTRCLVGAFTQFEQVYNGMRELAEYFEQPMLAMPTLLLRMMQSFVQTVPSDETSSVSPLHEVSHLVPALRSVLKELKGQDGLDLSAEDVRDRFGVLDFDFNLPAKIAEAEIPDPKLKKPPIPKASAAAVSTEEPDRGRNTYRERGGGGGRGNTSRDRGGGGGGGGGNGYFRQRSTSRSRQPATHCGLCGKSDHTNVGNCPQVEDSKWVPARDGVYQQVSCHNCHHHGHYAADCPGTLMADKLLADRNARFLVAMKEEAAANLAAAQPAAPNPWNRLSRDDGRYDAPGDDRRSETGSDTSEER